MPTVKQREQMTNEYANVLIAAQYLLAQHDDGSSLGESIVMLRVAVEQLLDYQNKVGRI